MVPLSRYSNKVCPQTSHFVVTYKGIDLDLYTSDSNVWYASKGRVHGSERLFSSRTGTYSNDTFLLVPELGGSTDRERKVD